MATVNPFDLLGDDDNDDPSTLIAAHQLKVPSQTKKPQSPAATQPQSMPAAKLPSKPVPPAQAVKEAKEIGRGGGRGGGVGGRGYGRGGRGGGGFNRETNNSENAFGGNRDFSGGRGPVEESDASRSSERRVGGYGGSRGSFRGGRRGAGFNDGEAGDGEQPRRVFERRSGTGRGYEMKREGAGRGNWGTPTDELSQVVEEVANEVEKIPIDEKTESAEADTTEGIKDTPANETEEKELENKDRTER